jgi:hypothetical protein
VDTPDCGTAAAPCATLLYAFANVSSAWPEDPVTLVVAAGRYGPDSCGLRAGRPLSLLGAGSTSTQVDCGGQDRLLLTTSDVVVSGLTVTGGRGIVAVAVVDGNGTDVVVGGGGGAVCIRWPTARPGLALLEDVQLVNNTLAGLISGPGLASVFVGGGALFVSGGGSGSRVELTRVGLTNNSVGVLDVSVNGVGTSCGGGACILVGAPFKGSTAPTWGAQIALGGVLATNNTLICRNCIG